MTRIHGVLILLLIVSGCRFQPARPEAKEPSSEEAAGIAEGQVPSAAEGQVLDEVRERVPELRPLTNAGTWIVSASSQEAEYRPEGAVDGSASTRWSSAFSNDQWWAVDFGKEEWLGKLLLQWETAYARKYRVLVSPDGASWSEVFSTDSGRGGLEPILFEPQSVRAVKIHLQERATPWGFSLFEVGFNQDAPVEAEATASSGAGDYAPWFAIDGKADTRWSSNFADNEWWQVRFPSPRKIAGLKISWETAFAEKYEIAVSMDANEWKTVYVVNEGDGRTDLLFFEPTDAQFVRIVCKQRGTGWGNSIWEVEFFDAADGPRVTASSFAGGHEPGKAMDGDPATVWRSAGGGEQAITVELPRTMAVGGVEMTWGSDYATRYRVESSADGVQWVECFVEGNGNGGRDYMFFAGRDAKYLRVVCQEGVGSEYALAEMELKGGEEQATPIREYQARARDAKPGRYPMWLRRQQEFWTVVGLPQDQHETIIGETGTLEPRKGDFCVMPFVLDGGELVTFADVELRQRLEQDVLPIPSVTWVGKTWKLDISPVAYGSVGAASTLVRYRFENTGDEPFVGRLALAVRPVQLNPIWQGGGMSPIRKAAVVADERTTSLKINGQTRIVFLTAPKAVGAAPLWQGDAVDALAVNSVPATATASDGEGRVSAAAMFDLEVPAGGHQDVVVAYLLYDQSELKDELVESPARGYEEAREQQMVLWSQLLAKPEITIPERRLIDVLKSNVGYVLINRDGPWFKPGTRNYNHSWMRDGALTGVAMLRMGKADLVREFIEAFSGFVAESGWVPFIIMEDGKPCAFNPNPDSGEGQEYDSQGQFPFIVRQYYDITGDTELVRRVYPQVARALRYIRVLRERRMTDKYKGTVFFGILPESNSHEGYFPAKHSYWDDFWCIRGLKDGAYLAAKLGETNDAAWFAAEEADLRKATLDSMLAVVKRDNLAYLPGCAELGDEDATSTSIAIMVCDEQHHLPPAVLKNTFDRYYERLARGRHAGIPDSFTPYEARNMDVFVRLGERDRALAIARHFTSDSTRPYGWNHLAEVVHANPRAASYIGDMPHTWVGADYINAVRSMLAYEEADRLVVAAGVDPKWLSAGGVTVKDLPTQYGLLNYRFVEADGSITLSVDGTCSPPGGFEVPLPPELAARSAEVNGQPAVIEHGSLRFSSLPVEVVLK